MAEGGFSPQMIQYMIAAQNNPAVANQLMQQQALAQQMMQQGGEQPNPNETINEGIGGARTVPMNRWGALARMGEQLSGAYLQNQNNQKLGALLANGQGMQSPQQAGTGENGPQAGPLLPWQQNAATGGTGAPPPQMQQGPMNQSMTPQEMLAERIMPGSGIAQYKQRMELANQGMMVQNGQIVPIPGFNQAKAGTAGAVKGAETGNSFVSTPEGPVLGSNLMGNRNPAPQQNPQIRPAIPGANPNPVSPQGNGGPIVLNPGVQASSKIPMAKDGVPLLPNLTQIPPADPHGLPNYGTPNTESGVNLNKQLTDGDVKANAAFANQSQSLGQEATRIQNLINTYQQIKSGTLTAQDPAFFQKLAAAGINDNPQQLSTLAGIQTATQNHILQIIGQIKDTNASLEGGQASRTFGSTINKLTEEGESAKDQPQALWNIITQAKGQVDHHLDMMQGYQQVGGMGNRLMNGTTMPADMFATQFTLAHPIDNYVQKAQQQTAPFMGMPGNNAQQQSSPITKTLNGKTYTNINGVWHQ